MPVPPTSDKHTHVISDRRSTYELPAEDPADGVGYIGMWVDGVQIAAAIRQDDHYFDRNRARWAMWSSGLSLDDAHPLAVRTEKDARTWLNLLADLAERGPAAVDARYDHRRAGR